MATDHFIISLFCRVDDAMPNSPKHPQALLYPSEVVTLALLFVLKGGGERPFYDWIEQNYRALFPSLPERTRLFRLFVAHQDWTNRFLATPTVLGVADSYGIELVHPYRVQRRPQVQRIGRKGLSNHRWIIGGKLAIILNQYGRICAWSAATANVHDSTFQPIIRDFNEQMVVFTDSNFASAAGNPANMKVCARGTWNERMMVETTFSMLTQVCHSKNVSHRVWRYFTMRLAFLIALFNLLVDWDGLMVDEHGQIHRSIAQFSL